MILGRKKKRSDCVQNWEGMERKKRDYCVRYSEQRRYHVQEEEEEEVHYDNDVDFIVDDEDADREEIMMTSVFFMSPLYFCVLASVPQGRARWALCRSPLVVLSACRGF